MLEKNNFPIQTCSALEHMFPSSLRSIPNPPASLYWRGEFNGNLSTIAIVGTRKASPEGKKLAYRTAYECAQAGWCVVSGLAFGIDRAAHEGALAGKGITWAVLAHGLDTVQPKSNSALALSILQNQGCLISEYPAHTPPLPHRFLERNRIISGLSRAVVVIEAPRSSGSLATAHHALAQNRPVFVFPGTPTNPLYAGSHELIRGGARLIRNVQDIWDDLSLFHNSSITKEQLALKTDSITLVEERVLTHLRAAKKPVSVDTLIENLELVYSDIQPVLASLCSRHHIKEVGPQLYEA